MATLFALLYVAFFVVAIVFLVRSILNKKKNKPNGTEKTIAIGSFVAFIVFFILTGVFSPKVEKENTDLADIEESTVNEIESTVPHQTEVDKEDAEDNTESIKEDVEEVQEEATIPEAPTAPLIKFIEAYIDHGKVETIKELAEEFGVYSDSKNSGTGRYYYKVALTQDDAKVISMDDLTKGDYCVVIQSDGEGLTYYNNVDLVQILYSDSSGYSVLDLSRLEPFENGTLSFKVDSLQEALEYTPSFSDELSPIELFYIECTIGATKDEFVNLIDKYGLKYKYRRSNSSDGYVSYSGSGESQTHIKFVGEETITDLDYYDYYVYIKYGLGIDYIDEDHVSKRTGNYPEPGYYIVGKDVHEYFETAEEAIKALHAYRTK